MAIFKIPQKALVKVLARVSANYFCKLSNNFKASYSFLLVRKILLNKMTPDNALHLGNLATLATLHLSSRPPYLTVTTEKSVHLPRTTRTKAFTQRLHNVTFKPSWSFYKSFQSCTWPPYSSH